MVATCTVRGLVLDSHGEPRPGTRVRFEPLVDVAVSVDHSALIVYTVVEVASDAAGVLPPTALVASDATGVQVPWRMTFRAAGKSSSWEFLAPAGGDLDVAQIPQLPAIDAPVETWTVFAAQVTTDADRAEAAAVRAEAAPSEPAATEAGAPGYLRAVYVADGDPIPTGLTLPTLVVRMPA